MTPDEKQALYRLADNLRVQRVVRRVTQQELAEWSGMHRTQMSLLENGQRQPLSLTLVRLCGALHLSPSELLEGVTWKPEVGGGSFVVSAPEPFSSLGR